MMADRLHEDCGAPNDTQTRIVQLRITHCLLAQVCKNLEHRLDCRLDCRNIGVSARSKLAAMAVCLKQTIWGVNQPFFGPDITKQRVSDDPAGQDAWITVFAGDVVSAN